MAHHSRYKRIAADRIPLLDEKVFERKRQNLVRRYMESDMTGDEYWREFIAFCDTHQMWVKTTCRKD